MTPKRLTGTLPPVVAARFSGGLFILAGALMSAQAAFVDQAAAGFDRGWATGTALAAIVVGTIVLRLPWHRWHPRATIALAVYGTLHIAASEIVSDYSAGDLAPVTYPSLFTVIIVWMGMTQPRWWALAATPIIYAAFALSVQTTADSQVPWIAGTVPFSLAAVIAELLAWMIVRDAARTMALEETVQLASILGLIPTRASTGQAVAVGAADVFRASCAVVALGDVRNGIRVEGRSGFVDGPNEVALADVLARVGTTRMVVHDLETRTAGFELVGTEGVVGIVAIGGLRRLGRATRATTAVFSSLIGAALQQRSMVESLRDHAVRDPLTGVGNRRRVSVLLDDLQPGDAVAIVDLDRFKAINDHNGHLYGDEVLCDLAEYLVTAIRDGDLVARYGGEEFVVVFRGAAATAEHAAERLLSGWRARMPATTFSMGVAIYDAMEGGADSLARADEALYLAKQRGRDRAVLARMEVSA